MQTHEYKIQSFTDCSSPPAPIVTLLDWTVSLGVVLWAGTCEPALPRTARVRSRWKSCAIPRALPSPPGSPQMMNCIDVTTLHMHKPSNLQCICNKLCVMYSGDSSVITKWCLQKQTSQRRNRWAEATGPWNSQTIFERALKLLLFSASHYFNKAMINGLVRFSLFSLCLILHSHPVA